MNLQDYVSLSGNKYLVIGKANWELDEVARTVAPDPRHFTLDGNEYTIISLEPLSIPQLTAYLENQNGQYEFGWTPGNGMASYLTHSQMLDLLATIPESE